MKPKIVVNCYTQLNYRNSNTQRNLNYSALDLCMLKLFRTFEGKRIGLPWIGGGLAGGDQDAVLEIISRQMTNQSNVTIVEYKPKEDPWRRL